MKKTARKTKGTQGLERKEAKKPGEQGAPARVFIELQQQHGGGRGLSDGMEP